MANNIFRVEDLIASNVIITGQIIQNRDNSTAGGGSIESYGKPFPYWLGKNHSDTEQGFTIVFQKTRGELPTSYDIVQPNDILGNIYFQGTDGEINRVAALIQSKVDGTPSLNSIPSNLIFSTTAQNETFASERMRIDDEGNIGIGTGSPAEKLHVEGNAIIGGSIRVGTAESPNSGRPFAYIDASRNNTSDILLLDSDDHVQIRRNISTTKDITAHFNNNGDVGIGITNPRTKLHVAGEITSSALGTGGGNFRMVQGNYGSFWRNDGANLYLLLTNSGDQYGSFNSLRPFSINVSNGNVSIGSAPINNVSLYTIKTIEGDATSYANLTAGEIQSGVTNAAFYYRVFGTTDNSPFTLNSLYAYSAGQSTIGAGSIVTNQYGFNAESSLTGASNNYGFYGRINGAWDDVKPKFNFYANGTAPNYFRGMLRLGDPDSYIVSTLSITPTGNEKGIAIYHGGNETPIDIYNWERNEQDFVMNSNGNIAIGGSAANNVTFYNRKPISGGAFSYANLTQTEIKSGVTSVAFSYRSLLSTENASFTLVGMQHYAAGQNTIGASSTVASQYGFVAASSLTGATANYGFYSDIASGANRWNFYANGTAENLFNGNVGLGLDPSFRLHLASDSAAKPSTNTWTISSDERLKENIEPADLNVCYDAIKNIPLKRYTWKNEFYSNEQVTDRSKIGWIAQDVKSVFPKAVGTYKFVYNQIKDKEGNVISEESINDCLSLNSDQIYAAMFGAIQKLMNTVENLQTRIEKLENK